MRLPTLVLSALILTLPLSAQTPNTWAKQADLPIPFVPNLTGTRGSDGATRSGCVGFALGSKGYIGTGGNSGDAPDFWEYDPATNGWTRKADYGGLPRRDAAAFSVGTKAYVGTGAAAGQLQRDVYEFDPVANTWTAKQFFGGVARFGAVGFSIGTKGYFGTGRKAGTTSFSLQDLWEFDPTTNAWTQKAALPGPARNRAVGFSIGSKGYIGTGSAEGAVSLNDFWEYDPLTNLWKERAVFPGVARFSAVGFGIGTKGYITTGAVGTVSAGHIANDLWEFDPTTNRWTRKADFPSDERFRASVFVVAGRGYVFGGSPSALGSEKKDLWEYNPATDVWTRKRDLGMGGGPRRVAAGFTLAGKGYVGTGWDGYSYFKDFWQYDPVTNTWSQKADFGGTARECAVGFAVGTKGYIGTGSDVSGPKQDLWQYDPATNSWSEKAPFAGGARQYAMAFAIGGKGYIGTGRDAQNNLKNDLWAFDPTTNAWSQKAVMGGAPRHSAAAFSMAGKAYVGTGMGSIPLKDLWAYDPATNTWTAKRDFGGAPRFEAVGFTAGMRGFIGTGYNGTALQSDIWEYDVVADTWTQRAEFATSARRTAVAFSIAGNAFITTGLSAVTYLGDLWKYTPDVSCTANAVKLSLVTDLKGAETTWEIARTGETDPVLNGAGYASSTTANVTTCLINGSYELKVLDNGNDGMTTGGYQLLDPANKRIIDNLGNGGFTSLSKAAVPFVLPLGPNELVSTSCDQIGLTTTSVIQAIIDPAVTTGGNTAQKGYEFLIFDPNGGFNVKVFQTIAAPGSGFPANTPAEQKPAYLKLTAVPGLPLNKLLNVRVRRNVNGVFNEYGPACRMKVVG